MHLKLLADASGLVSATKAGERALDALGGEAKDAGKALGTTGREARTTERQVDELGKEAKTTGRELDDMGREARGAGQDLEGMSRQADQASRATTRLGKASHSLRGGGKALAWGSEKIVNQYTALAGGAGIGLAMKKQMDLNDQITQMGIAARDSQGKINGQSFVQWADSVKRSVMEASKATGQGAEEMTSGMQAIIQRTGDMKLATENIELMGLAATASGSSVEEMGGLIANLGQNVGLKGTAQMKQALTLLVAQGKTGAFEIKDMLSQGERMFTAMPNFRVQGMEGLKSFGAFVQVSRTANGNAETAAESIVSLGTAIAKLDDKKLAKAGIRGLSLTNKDGSKRSTEEIVKEIIKRTKGDMDGLIKANVFDEPAQRLIQKMANSYASGKGFEAFDSFKNAGGDLSKNPMMDDDFLTRVQDTKFQLARLLNSLRDFGDKTLAAPLAHLTSWMQYFNAHGPLTEALIRKLAIGLGAMFAVAGTVKAIKLVQEFKEVAGLGRRPVGPSGLAAAIEGAGVQKVFVTNFPGLPRIGSGASTPGGLVDRFGNPISSSPGVPSSTIPTASAPGAWASWGRTAAIGTGIAGVGAVMGFMESGNTPEGWGRALGGAAGVALGAFGGPIGMMIGQQMGDTVGLILGGMVGDLMKDVEAQRKEKYKADREDITGHKVRKAFGEQMRVSDVTSSDRGGLEVAQRSSARAKALASSVLGNVVTDPKQTIQVNVETHVAADGTSQVKVSGDKAEVSTGFFKSYEKKMGSLTPQWALDR